MIPAMRRAPALRRLLTLALLAAAVVAAVGVIPIRGNAAGDASTAATPSFTREVAPIVRDRCAGCHRLGGIAPFAFRTAHDLTMRSDLIIAAVSTKRMPPWPPSEASPAYRGQAQRTLTPGERTTLLRWLRSGAKPDRNQIGSPRAKASDARPGETTRVLSLPSPYSPSAPSGGTDDYRCFLVDPKLTEDAFVTAARIEPGIAAIVHHVILFRVPPATVAAAEKLDASQSGPGWSCFGGTGIPSTGPDARNQLDNAPWIAAWAPGWGTGRLPEGVGVRLDAGSRVVMQVHYNLLNGRKPDRSRAVLQTVPASSPLRPLETMLLPAPIELPCLPSESGKLCDRAAAQFDQVARFGQDAAFIPAGLLILCGKNQQDPPAGRTSYCDRTIEQPTTIHTVAGHMHLLGVSIRVTLNPGTPRERLLLEIPHWDFHWQASYQLARAVTAAPGDVVRITCTHDQRLRRNGATPVARAPRYVLWGEGTTDEMCLGILQVTRP